MRTSAVSLLLCYALRFHANGGVGCAAAHMIINSSLKKIYNIFIYFILTSANKTVIVLLPCPFYLSSVSFHCFPFRITRYALFKFQLVNCRNTFQQCSKTTLQTLTTKANLWSLHFGIPQVRNVHAYGLCTSMLVSI